VFKGETEVVRALVDGGADPTAGQPSAVDTARMFGQTELLALFEQNPPAPDRRSGRPRAGPIGATDS